MVSLEELASAGLRRGKSVSRRRDPLSLVSQPISMSLEQAANFVERRIFHVHALNLLQHHTRKHRIPFGLAIHRCDSEHSNTSLVQLKSERGLFYYLIEIRSYTKKIKL